jgi:isoleucyl-tRNA synthetase
VAVARQVVTLGRAARAEAKLKVRQPLPRALVLLPQPNVLTPELLGEIADELNVKQVDLLDDLEGLLEYTVVPNFRALGPRVGPRMPRLKELLAAADGVEVRRALDLQGVYRVEVDGETIDLGPDDLDVRATAHDELVLVQEGGLAVALDTTLDDTLRAEGLARELVRALNDHRRELDLELSDRIRVELHAAGAMAAAAQDHHDWIMGEVLAVSLDVVEDSGDDGLARLTIGDTECRVLVEVAERA